MIYGLNSGDNHISKLGDIISGTRERGREAEDECATRDEPTPISNYGCANTHTLRYAERETINLCHLDRLMMRLLFLFFFFVDSICVRLLNENGKYSFVIIIRQMHVCCSSPNSCNWYIYTHAHISIDLRAPPVRIDEECFISNSIHSFRLITKDKTSRDKSRAHELGARR